MEDFGAFFIKHGIKSIHEDIGPIEYANQIVVAIAKHMFEAQKLMKSLWVETRANVVYTLNRFPMRDLNSIAPNESWSGRRPCIGHIRTCGNLHIQ